MMGGFPPKRPARGRSAGAGGSYSHHPAWRLRSDRLVTCPPECQARRLREREGENYENFLRCWIPLEEGYFSAFKVEEKADLVVDTRTL